MKEILQVSAAIIYAILMAIWLITKGEYFSSELLGMSIGLVVVFIQNEILEKMEKKNKNRAF